MDKNKLMACYVRQGLKQKDVAELLEMSSDTFRRRLTKPETFTLAELKDAYEKLDISVAEFMQIFFDVDLAQMLNDTK